MNKSVLSVLPGLKVWWLAAEGQQRVGLDSKNDQSQTKICQAEILKDTMRWHFNYFSENITSWYFNHFYLQLHHMLVYGKCKDVHLDRI